MQIRIATSLDRDAVRDVHLSAFPESEREKVSKLAVDLLSETTTPQTISLVAEIEDKVVGHVAFSPVTIGTNENCQGYILAPLGVDPAFQKRGIGSKLIEDGMQRLRAMHVDIVFVYGDPKYYGRFGFTPDAADKYTPPYALQYPSGWQGIALKECSTEGAPLTTTCVASLCDPKLW